MEGLETMIDKIRSQAVGLGEKNHISRQLHILDNTIKRGEHWLSIFAHQIMDGVGYGIRWSGGRIVKVYAVLSGNEQEHNMDLLGKFNAALETIYNNEYKRYNRYNK